jgi:hypothetical protein
LGLILAIVLVVAGIFAGMRVLAAPDLGPPPGGTAHGSTESVIAAALAGAAGTELVSGPHAVVMLSERDLTVIALARNPSPQRFRNPQARIRNGDIVVSAESSVGPLGVTAVARFTLVFSEDGGAPQITARAVDYEVGQLGLPGWVSDRLDPRGSATLNLGTLFAANPVLETLSQSMECVSVKADGVHVGFHRPGASADPSRCG